MVKRCKNETCKSQALYDSELCWDHIANKDDYKKALVEKIQSSFSLKGANLSKVDLSGTDLSRADLENADLSRSNLSDCNLFDANLKGAELLGANLASADLTGANLEGADLTRANLFCARLWHANLKNSNLIEADLSRSDLWNASLFNVKLWRTITSQALSISKNSFQSPGRGIKASHGINEEGILSAEEAYRTLKGYFISSGRYNDASWASFREKRMERLLLKKRKSLAYIPSLIMNFLCGYGERPSRIILSSSVVISLYAILFSALNAVDSSSLSTYKMSFSDYLYFSIVTFTTVGYGDFIPKASALFRLLSASEAFLGAFMIGLFIFTLARRYSAR